MFLILNKRREMSLPTWREDMSVIEAWPCSKLNLISRGQLSRREEAARPGPPGEVLCQSWPKLRGSEEKTGPCQGLGLLLAPIHGGLQHSSCSIYQQYCCPAVDSLMKKPCCVHASAMCVCTNVCLRLGVCVPPRMDANTLGEGACTGGDREGIELERMRQIRPATRSLIYTAIALKR